MLYLILLFLSPFSYGNSAKVTGDSMLPILKDRQKVSYTTEIKDLKRNDIILFKIFSKRVFTKTLIALPGDKVEVQDKNLFINDSKIKNRSNSFIIIRKNQFKMIKKSLKNSILKADRYLVFSENKNNDFDSRKYGAIKKSMIIGKLLLPDKK